MSKKNKKSTKRAQHAFDVQSEWLALVSLVGYPLSDKRSHTSLLHSGRFHLVKSVEPAGERLEVVKKQLKVQKKQQKAVPVKDSPKKKLKGIRIRKGVRIRVGPTLTYQTVITSGDLPASC